MSRRERARDAKPVPVTEAVRHLIRSTTVPASDAAPERAGHGEEGQPTPSRIRSFAADGEDWIARIAGESTAGSDSFAAPALVAIRFARARTPEHDEREILIPRGRFQSLRDEEFADLLEKARPLQDPDDPPRSRRGGARRPGRD